MRTGRVVIGLLAGIVLAAAPLRAEDRLTPLLALVPAEAANAGAGLVYFNDFAASRAAFADLLAAAGAAPWEHEPSELAAGWRMLAAPRPLHNYLQFGFSNTRGLMPVYLGFAWEDIAAMVTYGPLGTQAMVIGGSPAVTDAAAVGGALTGRGFAVEARGGHDVWWQHADGSSDPHHIDPTDLLYGSTGEAARAAVAADALLVAPDWVGMDTLLAAADGGVPTLAGSPDLGALAYALAQPVAGDGVLVQAVLHEGAVDLRHLAETGYFATSGADRRAEDEAVLQEIGAAVGTPAYRAYAIGDRQEGARAIALIALVYDSRADAETATETVAEAARTGVPPRAYGWTFARLLPFEVASDVVEVPDGSRYVARITFSATLPAPRDGNPGDFSRGPLQALWTLVFETGLIAGLVFVPGP